MRNNKDFRFHSIGDREFLVPKGSKVTESNGLVLLNPLATFIWRLLDSECTEAEVVSSVVAEFDVEINIAQLDVKSFLNEIRNMGLLHE